MTDLQDITSELRALVEAEVDVKCWEGSRAYLTRCPGEHLHGGPSSGSPLIYTEKGIPFAHCLHQSCRPVLDGLNVRLREAAVDLLDGHDIKIELTPEERAERTFRKHLRVLRCDARLKLTPKIFNGGVPLEEWQRQSPVEVADWPVKAHWALYLAGLFAPTDLLWIGALWETGREYRHCFRRTSEWVMEMDCSPGPQICAAPLKDTVADRKELRTIMPDDEPEHAARNLIAAHKTAGTALIGYYRVSGHYRRAKEFIRNQPYVVLESDTMDKVRFGDLVLFMRKYTILRALTDTGGKSIHALFDRPRLTEAKTRELYAILEGLGADAGTLGRACPTTRLPGCKRLDDDFNVLGWQRLLYLNPKFTV